VEDFGELRAGMLIVAKMCLECGRSHRGMLTNLAGPDEIEGGGDGWDYLPQPHLPVLVVMGTTAVIERRLYRVIDPALESSSSQTTSTPTHRPARVGR